MKKYRSSPERVTLANVVSAEPGAAPVASPQSTPAGTQSRVLPPGSHLRPMSSASPVYSPAPSTPSTDGAAAAAGIVVLGTTPSVSVSLPVPPLLYVVVIGTLTLE